MEPGEHDRAVARISHLPHLAAVLVAGRLAAAPGRAPRPLGPGRPRRHARRGERPGAVAADPRGQLRGRARPPRRGPRGPRRAHDGGRLRRGPGPRRDPRPRQRRHGGDPRQARRPGATDALGLRRGARPPGRAGPPLRRRRRDRHQHRGRPHRPRPGHAPSASPSSSSSAAVRSSCSPLSNPAGGRPTGNLLAREHRRQHRADRSLVIAVDGTSGSGKSSTSRGVADRLGLRYLDTGAMFRAMTWWLLREGVDVRDPAAVAAAAGRPTIESGTDPLGPTITVDGTDVSVEIRARRGQRRGQPGQRRAGGACPPARPPARGHRWGRHRRRGPRHRVRRVAAGRGEGLPQRRPRRPRRSVVRPSRAAPTSPAPSSPCSSATASTPGAPPRR